MEHCGTERTVEEGENIPSGKPELSRVLADDPTGDAEPFEIGLGDLAKFGRVFNADQLSKIMLGGDDERPALPGTDINEAELPWINPSIVYRPLASCGRAGFVANTMDEVLVPQVSKPNDSGCVNTKSFVEWFGVTLWFGQTP
jgi:hypothetical protein